MNAYEMCDRIRAGIAARLPGAFIVVEFSSGIYESIHVRFASIGKEGWLNGIIQNDHYHTLISIDGFNKDGSVKGKHVLKQLCGNRIKVRGKTTADSEKIVDYVIECFGKISVTIDKINAAIKEKENG